MFGQVWVITSRFSVSVIPFGDFVGSKILLRFFWGRCSHLQFLLSKGSNSCLNSLISVPQTHPLEAQSAPWHVHCSSSVTENRCAIYYNHSSDQWSVVYIKVLFIKNRKSTITHFICRISRLIPHPISLESSWFFALW